jgi:PhnB protein
MPAKPIPDGFHTVTPYLFAEGAPRLVEFISKAFRGEVIYRKQRSDGSVMHATMRIGDSMLMLAEATKEFRPMPTSPTSMCPIATLSIDKRWKPGASRSLTS